MAAALTMKEVVFCFNIMLKLDFDESFDSVPLYIDNTSALHVADKRTCSPRENYVALRYSTLPLNENGIHNLAHRKP